MDAKWDLKLSKALFTSEEIPSLSRGLNIARFYRLHLLDVRLPCHLELNSGQSISVKREQNEETLFSEAFKERACFHNVSQLQFPHGKHCFQCQFLFPRCKVMLP